MRRYTPSTPKKSRRIWMWVGIAFIALGIVIASIFLWQHRSNRTDQAVTPQPRQDINFEPATPEEEKESDSHKSDDPKDSTPTNPIPTDNSGKKVVTPLVTSAEQSGSSIDIAALVPGIVEDGGTCTVTLSQGNTTITRTSNGVMNASNTNCATFSLNRSDFSAAGTWKIVVAYQSSTAKGSSAGTDTVEIK